MICAILLYEPTRWPYLMATGGLSVVATHRLDLLSKKIRAINRSPEEPNGFFRAFFLPERFLAAVWDDCTDTLKITRPAGSACFWHFWRNSDGPSGTFYVAFAERILPKWRCRRCVVALALISWPIVLACQRWHSRAISGKTRRLFLFH